MSIQPMKDWKTAPDDYQDIASCLADFSKFIRRLEKVNHLSQRANIDTQDQEDREDSLRGCNSIAQKLVSIATA